MKRTAKSLIFWSVLGVSVFLSTLQSRHLSAMRRAGLPEAAPEYATDTPPALNFIMAGLGGFRGIVSEILWFRAERLQEQSRYLELVQLSDWLTMLDPHAAEAWAYNAWNLAYNVSVMMIRPEDRLRWVQNGISLLRDKGIRMNPKEARLYRELAWMYLNKVGGTLDEAHRTYQQALAEKMTPALDENGMVKTTKDAVNLLRTFRLDPEKMKAIGTRFPGLDWRKPEAHAIYWALSGIEFASENEELFCRRIAYQALFLLLFQSTPAEQPFDPKHLSIIPPIIAFLRETETKFPTHTMNQIILRFLAQTTSIAHEAGDATLAQTCYQTLLQELPDSATKPTFEQVIQLARGFTKGR